MTAATRQTCNSPGLSKRRRIAGERRTWAGRSLRPGRKSSLLSGATAVALIGEIINSRALASAGKEKDVTIISKYSGLCTACKQSILVGDKIEWLKEIGKWHLACVSTPKPSFQRTEAGLQGMIQGTESRNVPLTALKPTVRQTEQLTALESTLLTRKQTSFNLSPAIAASMLQDVQAEKDVSALFDLAIDQTLPRDIRRSAGDRLNDCTKAASAFILASENKELLGKLSRAGTISNMLQTFAKGRLTHLNERKAA